MLKKFLLVLIVIAAVNCYPQPPVWLNHFKVPFLRSVNNDKWTGMMYYDWTNNKERLDSDKSQKDSFCSTVYPTDEKCIQVVKDSWRYIYVPNYEGGKCCKCCNTTMGCGIMKNNWLDGATYIGHEKWNGTDCIGWEQKGNQNNYYFVQSNVYPTLQIPCAIRINSTQVDEKYIFNRTKFDRSPLDPKVFDVIPENCNQLCKNEKQKSFCEYFQ
ncbi:hypothetical protein M0813_27791 [Anaeramoeba flamelloides]|uniref:Transmembrane protein n=1 Tax=Anaeramoeba flamelloides TaxID=1746091 RepID=A0AAV8A7D8_9EUKA|nr:hypothetical protein M0812_01357 [Anaeramoeba flamelloides]KAJ6236404.1 hypothetical protein M0813_27791 [Anaeramoeba flamelloides]|eukprot:Anaeramoba_flamelloidesa585399_134.p1 GENE.a585399_134~~a585399_134.p1  ORF type:complete len:214 (-),score=37.81 a585399_134:38-679(-)